ncbi:succinate dehydrogenase cytochrome b558 subunit [Cytobacillus depressus]|uniref:succinate dehydrogenase cytochrome b558 subunit n=1 Tax=Cytobacillus depressus TaxID=1602942 RepID=UPI001FE5506A|nr:succinate dehydrogenase cytochrome b558 subunit [Cytobacillus depressus]
MQTNTVGPLIQSRPSNKRGKFVLSRLHSLAGLIPLGLFLIQHLMGNALAIQGSERFNEHVQFMTSLPFLLVLEIVFIALPLLFHAVYGIYLSFISKPNAHVYKYGRNISFLLQRITGVITFIFVIYHVWALRIGPALKGTEVNFQLVSEHLSNPFIFVFYLAGVLSTVYHFSNGISTAFITWGITIGPASQKTVRRICSGVFVILAVMSVWSLLSFVS